MLKKFTKKLQDYIWYKKLKPFHQQIHLIDVCTPYTYMCNRHDKENLEIIEYFKKREKHYNLVYARIQATTWYKIWRRLEIFNNY